MKLELKKKKYNLLEEQNKGNGDFFRYKQPRGCITAKSGHKVKITYRKQKMKLLTFIDQELF